MPLGLIQCALYCAKLMPFAVKPGFCLLRARHLPGPGARGRDTLFGGPGETTESPSVGTD